MDPLDTDSMEQSGEVEYWGAVGAPAAIRKELEEPEPSRTSPVQGSLPKPSVTPTAHLGGEGPRLPVVVQHLVRVQVVIIHDIPFDSPEEVRCLVLYQPRLARRDLHQHPASTVPFLWTVGTKLKARHGGTLISVP